MGVLIDASVLIDHGRGRASLGDRLAGQEDEKFFLSVVTASELLHGAHRAGGLSTTSRRSAFVEAVLERFPLFSVDLATARAHARLWAEPMSEGRLMGPHDLWLAATCLAHGLTMVTGNAREFARARSPGGGLDRRAVNATAAIPEPLLHGPTQYI